MKPEIKRRDAENAKFTEKKHSSAFLCDLCASALKERTDHENAA